MLVKAVMELGLSKNAASFAGNCRCLSPCLTVSHGLRYSIVLKP
jgi:hypothetical protein